MLTMNRQVKSGVEQALWDLIIDKWSNPWEEEQQLHSLIPYKQIKIPHNFNKAKHISNSSGQGLPNHSKECEYIDWIRRLKKQRGWAGSRFLVLCNKMRMILSKWTRDWYNNLKVHPIFLSQGHSLITTIRQT